MSEEDYIDFKKEFEEFKRELENSKPIFDDESIEFDDFGNLISSSENNDNFENFSNSNNDHPQISLETDDILMNMTIKKDYSAVDDLDERKKEFIKDLKEFIDEFESTEESTELMKYYD
ncbi:hypothetical protein [Methanobrevibacter sp.]|uniref:hypothetical protein n=1 Tax=Methanobrevibacter sp. TaxID=66852 RepID=UPI0025D8E7DD|nr:hypothetical protein [Methanobrevibacter sp.]MBQ2963009.1 hypothetical protein [Methanobrevibacter sp.]